MMPDIGFLNGRFMPLAEAMVPVEDRGYQFGDGVYEVIRTYRGVPFQVEAHLARLERSAGAIGLPLPFRTSEWLGYVTEGIRLAGYAESKVYLQLTRGVAPRDHLFPVGTPPTAVMTIREMRSLDPVLCATGVPVITVEDLRWGRCDSGVTRAVVLDLARKEGIPVEERAIRVEELRGADEIFLTGTTVEILPVISVDSVTVGTGRLGELTRLLSHRFRSSVE